MPWLWRLPLRFWIMLSAVIFGLTAMHFLVKCMLGSDIDLLPQLSGGVVGAYAGFLEGRRE